MIPDRRFRLDSFGRRTLLVAIGLIALPTWRLALAGRYGAALGVGLIGGVLVVALWRHW